MELTHREIATILASLQEWKDELREGAEWIADSLYFAKCSPLTSDEVDELHNRLDRVSEAGLSSVETPRCHAKSLVSTYVGTQHARSSRLPAQPDFAPPMVPVLIHEADGIRLVLGTHDYNDHSKPDVQVERRPHGWAIFLHPNAGDPIACVYLLDDGRSYLLPERFTDPPIEIVDEIPPDLDRA